jgi:hypothetical protein
MKNWNKMSEFIKEMKEFASKNDCVVWTTQQIPNPNPRSFNFRAADFPDVVIVDASYVLSQNAGHATEKKEKKP